MVPIYFLRHFTLGRRRICASISHVRYRKAKNVIKTLRINRGGHLINIFETFYSMNIIHYVIYNYRGIIITLHFLDVIRKIGTNNQLIVDSL